MRSFKKFLIACGLCLGVGLAFGTSEVRAEIRNVIAEYTNHEYSVTFEDTIGGSKVSLYFGDGSKYIDEILTDPTPGVYGIPVSEEDLLECAADDGREVYYPHATLKIDGVDDPIRVDDPVPLITLYSIVLEPDSYTTVEVTPLHSCKTFIKDLPGSLTGKEVFSLNDSAEVDLKAIPKSKFIFSYWMTDEERIEHTGDAISNVQINSPGGDTYRFYSGKITGLDIDKTRLSPGDTAEVKVQNDGTVSPTDFEFSINPEGYATISPTSGVKTATITANTATTSKLRAVLKSKKYLGLDVPMVTEEFSIIAKPVVELSNNILTAGEAIDLSLKSKGGVATVEPDGADNITWKENGKPIDNIFSSGVLDGHTLTPTVYYGDTSMVGDPVTITVYPYPTIHLEEDDDEYELTVNVPKAAGSGNKSINPVAKYYLHLDRNSTVWGYYPDVEKGYVRSDDGKLTIDDDELKDFIQDVAKKKQSHFDDKEKIEVRFVIDNLSDKNGNTIEGIENESDKSFYIYRVTVMGDNAETKYYYGLKGQKIKISPSMKSGATFDSWEDGNKDNPRSITISSDTDKNKYRVIATGKASTTASTAAVTPTTPTTPSGTAGGNTNLDKVPKTGEGNAILWVLMVSVITIIGAGSAVYYKMKAPKKAEVNYEAQVRDVTFANPEALMQEKLNRRNNDSSRRK